MGTPKLDRSVAEIARAQHGLITLEQLTDLGMTRRQRQLRLQYGRWESPYEGVYQISGVATTWRTQLLAACLAGGGYGSHRSAAALWDLPGARRDRVEITTERWDRARHPGLIVHETLLLTDVDTTACDGVPVTTVERTLFDLCACCSPMGVDLALDSALRRDLTTLDVLAVVEARVATRGRRGSKMFHELLAARRPGDAVPESAPERLLARALVRQGLPQPVAQFVVRDPEGHVVARTDLAYPAWNIVIEYDSYEQHVGKHALVRDGARRNALVALGFTPVTATAEDLRDQARRLASTIRRIRDRAA